MRITGFKTEVRLFECKILRTKNQNTWKNKKNQLLNTNQMSHCLQNHDICVKNWFSIYLNFVRVFDKNSKCYGKSFLKKPTEAYTLRNVTEAS